MKNNTFYIVLYVLTYLLFIPVIGSLVSSHAAIVYFILAFTLCILLIYKVGIEKLLYFKKRELKKYIVLLLSLIFINGVVSIILHFVFEVNMNIPVIFKNYILIYMILSVIIVPITEEIIWKEVMLSNTSFLKRKTIIKIILIGCVFSLLHVSNFNSVIANTLAFMYYLVFYIMTSIFYIKDKNIFLIILIHAISNLIASAAVLL